MDAEKLRPNAVNAVSLLSVRNWSKSQGEQKNEDEMITSNYGRNLRIIVRQYCFGSNIGKAHKH